MKPTALSRLSFTLSLFKFRRVLHPPLPHEYSRLLGLVKDSFRRQLDELPSPPVDSHVSAVLASLPSSVRARDPIGRFEEMVATGCASVAAAGVCLRQYLDSGGGAQDGVERVLRGLERSGLGGPRDIIISHPRVCQSIVEALVVEGREDVLVRWAASDIPGVVKVKMLRHAITALAGVEGGGVQKSVEMFFAFLDALADENGKYRTAAFQSLGKRLCNGAASRGLAGGEPLERLVSSSNRWSQSESMEAAIQLRFARRTELAVKHFTDLDSPAMEDLWGSRNARWYSNRARMALELALVCLDKGQLDDAETIVGILRRRFCEKVPGLEGSALENVQEGTFAAVLTRLFHMLKPGDRPKAPEGKLQNTLDRLQSL